MQTGDETRDNFKSIKALVVPINSKNQIFIQDRRGYKKPDWGYFGGGVEGDETPLDAVIRESQEELSIHLKETDLAFLGTSSTDWDGNMILRYVYLYSTEQKEFDVREGRGGHWMTFEEANMHMDKKDKFEEVIQMIQKVREE